MSTEQLEVLEQLARRAVACKRWRWMPGMRVLKESGWAEPASERVPCSESNGGYYYPSGLPDLSDPATLGCLVALVRETWSEPGLHARPEGGWWRVWNSEWPGAKIYPTEAEALVAALEDAP